MCALGAGDGIEPSGCSVCELFNDPISFSADSGVASLGRKNAGSRTFAVFYRAVEGGFFGVTVKFYYIFCASRWACDARLVCNFTGDLLYDFFNFTTHA